TPAGVLGLMMREGTRLGAIGLAIGLVGAFGVARAMGRVLYGLSPGDPGTVVLVPLTLAGRRPPPTHVPAAPAGGRGSRVGARRCAASEARDSGNPTRHTQRTASWQPIYGRRSRRNSGKRRTIVNRRATSIAGRRRRPAPPARTPPSMSPSWASVTWARSSR